VQRDALQFSSLDTPGGQVSKSTAEFKAAVEKFVQRHVPAAKASVSSAWKRNDTFCVIVELPEETATEVLERVGGTCLLEDGPAVTVDFATQWSKTRTAASASAGSAAVRSTTNGPHFRCSTAHLCIPLCCCRFPRSRLHHRCPSPCWLRVTLWR
jgi:hypothetical protein